MAILSNLRLILEFFISVHLGGMIAMNDKPGFDKGMRIVFASKHREV